MAYPRVGFPVAMKPVPGSQSWRDSKPSAGVMATTVITTDKKRRMFWLAQRDGTMHAINHQISCNARVMVTDSARPRVCGVGIVIAELKAIVVSLRTCRSRITSKRRRVSQTHIIILCFHVVIVNAVSSLVTRHVIANVFDSFFA